MPSGNLIPLAGGSVLYLGSAVPLETSVGLEALQMPLRDRYLTGDPYQKVSGIDSILTVFSGGLLMQYPGDDSSSTWFPMQTLHMCAAVKAVSTQGSARFVSLDSPQGQASREPPIFAVIMRRAKGVKVLECHVFVCKSTEAALAYVQACTHAFGHQEGWMNDIPGSDLFRFGASSRIIAADSMTSSMTDGMPRVPLQGFLYSADQPVQHYNISGREPPVQVPAPPQPAPAAQVAVAQTPGQYIVMNPPGAPVPQVPQMTIPQGYFADWDRNYGMSYMIIPGSPLVDEEYKKKKKHHHKKKKSKKEEELYYVRRSRRDQGDEPQDYAPVQQPTETVNTHHEVHYIPLPQNQYPAEDPAPPADPTADPATEYYILRKPKDQYGYAADDQARTVHGPFHFREGVLEGPDTEAVYASGLPQQQGVYASGLPQQGVYASGLPQQGVYASGPQQGVYERRLPRVDYPVYGDDGGFNNMAYSLGYIP